MKKQTLNLRQARFLRYNAKSLFLFIKDKRESFQGMLDIEVNLYSFGDDRSSENYVIHPKIFSPPLPPQETKNYYWSLKYSLCKTGQRFGITGVIDGAKRDSQRSELYFHPMSLQKLDLDLQRFKSAPLLQNSHAC